jgi:hypothetical protein
MSDLHWMTATEAALAITARKLSPVELMKALLERIARLDPKLNVFIRFDGDAAMDAAKAAEAEVASGRLRGPLHGVPVGVKDIIDVAGLPTTCHSKILIDNVVAADALCVSRACGPRRSRRRGDLAPDHRCRRAAREHNNRRALVIVSRVVKVFEETMKSVSDASRSRTASAKSVPSTLETKRNVIARSL